MPAGLVGETGIIAATCHMGDFKPLVMVNAAVRIIGGLVWSPLTRACGRKREGGDCIGGEVPEPCVFC